MIRYEKPEDDPDYEPDDQDESGSKIEINVGPHPGQDEVHKDPHRFKVLAAGRRWGKTRLGVNECIAIATKGGIA